MRILNSVNTLTPYQIILELISGEVDDFLTGLVFDISNSHECFSSPSDNK